MLTQEQLKEILHYDPSTGIFTWLKSARPGWNGKRAGYTHEGYIEIGINGQIYKAHRLAWLYMTGSFPKKWIDHDDLNRANNVFSNLREAEPFQNHSNHPLYCSNTSGIKGVYFHKANNRWVGYITHKKQRFYLGSFKAKEEAEAVVREKRIELHKEFARHA